MPYVGQTITEVFPTSINVDSATISGNTTIGGTLGVTGVSTLSDNIVFGASSKGVHLGVTSATASNLLEDYEEGTWTPAFDSGTGGYAGSALGSITSAYRKIGNMVYLSAAFTVTGGGNLSAGDSLEFTGQPFTPISSIFMSRMGVSSVNQSVGSGTMAVGVVAATSTNPGSMRAMIAQKSGTVPATAFTIINISYPTG